MNLFREQALQRPFSMPLHALRGIAALTVLCCHIVDRAFAPTGVYVPHFEPFNGSAAVCFFYVLSGLVLGASLARRHTDERGYGVYIVRRLFRIMPLMIVTVTFGGLYLVLIDPHVPSSSLPEEYGGLTIAKFMAGYIGYSKKPNPVAWSIFVELVASMLLPFMVLTGRRPVYVVGAGLLLAVFGAFDLGQHHSWNFFMIDFFAGLTILWWGKPFAARMARMPPWLFWTALGILLCVFYGPREIWTPHYGDPRFNLVEMAGITPLIAIVFFMPERFSLLEWRPFAFLGEVSYSLYLTHWFLVAGAYNAVIILCPALIHRPVPVSIGLLAAMVPVCLAVALWSFRHIEQPGINLGRRVNDRLGKRSA